MAALPTRVTRSPRRPAAASGRTVALALAVSIVLALAVAHTLGYSPQRRDPASMPAPQRIVSLVPATTEMLFAMGAGSQVVGVGSYEQFPPEVLTLPRLGGLLDPNIERLIAIRPDLVVYYDTQTELRRQLDRAGIPTFAYTHRTLADVMTTVRALGDRIGRRADGERVAHGIESSLAATRARVAGRPRPRTLLVFGREAGSLRGINASGGYGFLHDLLEVAGGSDVLGGMNRQSVAMSSEMVIARAPDVIIELHYGQPLPPNQVDAERRVWSALASVPAVRNGRVYLLVGNEFVVPGPRVSIAADRLARTIHPEVFR